MTNGVGACLKAVRDKANITIRQAARWAGVSERAWHSYEAESNTISFRKPKESVIRCFFYRSGLPIPEELGHYFIKKGKARVISLSSYKGGVGKSPISIAIASCLVKKGFKVACVTNDVVYRCMVQAGKAPETGSLVSDIAFFDEDDVAFTKDEVSYLAKELKRLRIYNKQLTEKGIGHAPLDTTTLEDKHRRKATATTTLKELKNSYDYIFLDMNREPEKLRNHADLVCLIVDLECRDSIFSAQNYKHAIGAASSARPSPAMFGLLTNCNGGGSSGRSIGYVGNYFDISDDIESDMEHERKEDFRWRLSILNELETFDTPILWSRLSRAHTAVIDEYNSGREILDGFCYFHSVIDAAPNSLASLEIESLTDELTEYRL